MTIVDVVEYMRDWIQNTVSPQRKLKIPPAQDFNPVEDGYDYRLESPMCFAFFLPTEDKLPPGILYCHPCIVVQPVNGSDDPLNNERITNLKVWFSVWDPGTHGQDVFLPTPTSGVYEQWTGEEAAQWYVQNAEGWRDCWNLVDLFLHELENAQYVSGIRLCTEQAISWGPLQEADSSIVDAYPYFLAWVEFAVSVPLVPKTPDVYKDFFS